MRTTVRQKGDGSEYHVVQDLAPNGAIVVPITAKFTALTWFMPEAMIDTPPAPKAEPGVRYRATDGGRTLGIGLADGQIAWATAQHVDGIFFRAPIQIIQPFVPSDWERLA